MRDLNCKNKKAYHRVTCTSSSKVSHVSSFVTITSGTNIFKTVIQHTLLCTINFIKFEEKVKFASLIRFFFFWEGGWLVYRGTFVLTIWHCLRQNKMNKLRSYKNCELLHRVPEDLRKRKLINRLTIFHHIVRSVKHLTPFFFRSLDSELSRFFFFFFFPLPRIFRNVSKVFSTTSGTIGSSNLRLSLLSEDRF